jgi:hypothetical protein
MKDKVLDELKRQLAALSPEDETAQATHALYIKGIDAPTFAPPARSAPPELVVG